MNFDILIVGSGPSGVHAAIEAVRGGASVGMIDVGYEDRHYAGITPNRPWSELRSEDPEQHRYFLGEDRVPDDQPSATAGVHLTPARRHAVRAAARLLPLESQTFDAVQSLARGGLGAAWGAGCARFTEAELERAGLPADEMRPWYERVAADIGVSAPQSDDISDDVGAFRTKQPPLELDSNAACIVRTYLERRARINAAGLRLGQPPVAVLSEDKDGRGANPYHDMDFWTDGGGSVWRPGHALDRLNEEPGFHYLRPRLAESFEERLGGAVTVQTRNPDSGAGETFSGRRLLLAAGAINSARLVLRSMGSFGVETPLLCNPYTMVPALNLPMLGRAARDRRHSMIQLSGVYRPANDTPGQSADEIMVQFYSYRSLLLFRLAREMPLPPALAMTLTRAIVTCLTIATINHPDGPGATRRMALSQAASGGDFVTISGGPGLADTERRGREREVVRILRKLSLLPLKVQRMKDGASIHYAGTMPSAASGDGPGTHPDGRVRGTRNVYAVDGSGWNFLPAKGLTFTLMANARRLGARITAELMAGSP